MHMNCYNGRLPVEALAHRSWPPIQKNLIHIYWQKKKCKSSLSRLPESNKWFVKKTRKRAKMACICRNPWWWWCWWYELACCVSENRLLPTTAAGLSDVTCHVVKHLQWAWLNETAACTATQLGMGLGVGELELKSALFTAHELNWTPDRELQFSVNSCIGIHVFRTNRAQH